MRQTAIKDNEIKDHPKLTLIPKICIRNNVYTRSSTKKDMEPSQIDGLKKKLKKNNDDALDFVQKLESTLTDFEKTGNLSGSYSEIKKAVLAYKDKIINQI